MEVTSTPAVGRLFALTLAAGGVTVALLCAGGGAGAGACVFGVGSLCAPVAAGEGVTAGSGGVAGTCVGSQEAAGGVLSILDGIFPVLSGAFCVVLSGVSCVGQVDWGVV